MTENVERKYLLRRYTQERELALAATGTKAAQIHFAMAFEYERRLCQIGETGC